ncbi:MAG: acetyltransferase, partial [Chloroflexota bacterium]|jgi:RimJ/RimL family protein N-acetyltransferase
VVCEAATGAAVEGLIEVGVTTREDERGRGLATAACAALITSCEADGLSTWWDCAAQNTPSTRLARRLGFRDERTYRYCLWQKRVPD